MPYILKEFEAKYSKKIDDFLKEDLKLSNTLTQKLLDKGKVLDENNNRYQKNQKIKSKKIKLYLFEAITKGLKPLFETEHFAIFDKPSNLLVHPSSNNQEYTLLDEIKYHLNDNASLVNRIDKETSGLVLVSKNKYCEFILKDMFEEKKFIKKYLAIVEGKIINSQEINTPIKKANSFIKLKMQTSKDGKESLTIINPIFYDKNKNQTLIEAIPKTGRQHQIRVHLNSISHNILGDPIYGISEKDCDLILKNKLSVQKRIDITKSERLLLHSKYLEFEFLGIQYKIISKQDFKI